MAQDLHYVEITLSNESVRQLAFAFMCYANMEMN